MDDRYLIEDVFKGFHFVDRHTGPHRITNQAVYQFNFFVIVLVSSVKNNAR